MSSELEAIVEQKSREEWVQNSAAIRKDVTASDDIQEDEVTVEGSSDNMPPIVDFVDDEPEEV